MGPRVYADTSRREGVQQFSHVRARATNVSNELALAPDQSRWSERRIRACARSPAAQTELMPQALPMHIGRA